MKQRYKYLIALGLGGVIGSSLLGDIFQEKPVLPSIGEMEAAAWSKATGVKPVTNKGESTETKPQIEVILRPEGLVQETKALLNQDAIKGVDQESSNALLAYMSESALIRTPMGVGLYNFKDGTVSFGRTFAEGVPVDVRGVSLAILKVVESRRDIVNKEISGDTVSLSDEGSDPFAVGIKPEKAIVDVKPEKASANDQDPVSPKTNTDSTLLKLDKDQNDRIVELMNQYLEKKRKDSGVLKEQGNDVSQMPTEITLKKDVAQSSNNGSGLKDTQVNVSQIRESNTAIFYKGTLLPKAGFDQEGNALPANVKSAQVKAMLNRIVQAGDKWSIHYPAVGEVKKTIAIFGDPTCPVCKSLHEYIPELQKAGVDIYYLLYNRKLAPHTVGSPAASAVDNTMTNIWCAEDSGAALSEAFRNGGRYNEYTDCSTLREREKSDFPGNGHYLMGRLIDMEGTPYTITDDGQILTGFSERSPQPMSYLRRIGL